MDRFYFVTYNFTIFESDDAMGFFYHAGIVGGEDEGNFFFPVQLFHNVEQVFGRVRIEVSGGFVITSYSIHYTKLYDEFILQMQGIPKKERETRVVELLTAVGLGDRLDSRPSKLSGGQQQRVAVARALASKPSYNFV